ncbi:hypothetical protein F4775DRAFT_125542 [Biscogniauxia sp. FL1348]|nr:hypothetical protein F4775DRAFT_125542 [Biscogniauxia sp. FL1348]
MARRLGRLPMPFTIGNDICHIPRILKILQEEGKGLKFVRRILAPDEIEQPWTKPLLRIILEPTSKDTRTETPRDAEVVDTQAAAGSSSEMLRAARFMAGRFAVKEAVVKAHPHRRLTWHGIIIDRPYLESFATNNNSNTTKTEISPPLKKEGTENLKDGDPQPGSSRPPVALIKGDGRYADTQAAVSISHDGDYASAVCLGCYEEPVGER